MKKLSFLLFIALAAINVCYAGGLKKQHNPKDTLSVKCLLFSPDLFYGIELGEKPLRDMVDTLVSQINMYDSSDVLNLVIVSGRDLGFTNQQDILWQQIIDSAQSRGYGICPPQAGPEIFVLSQNQKNGHNLLARKVATGKPVFIGMNKIAYKDNTSKGQGFNYVFCIKSNGYKNSYSLGYSATSSVNRHKKYTWSSSDMFIFVNKKHPVKHKNILRYCISGAVVGNNE